MYFTFEVNKRIYKAVVSDDRRHAVHYLLYLLTPIILPFQQLQSLEYILLAVVITASAPLPLTESSQLHNKITG